MANRKKLTKLKRDMFLAVLREKANASAAARALGVSPQALYIYKDLHPTFAAEW